MLSERNRLNILLISKSYEFYCYTKRIVCNQADLCWCEFEQLDSMAGKEMDVVIIDFNQNMVHDHSFHIIIKIKGKFQERIPILAVMEGETIQDIFEVLALGALDYMDKGNIELEYKNKISSMIYWRFYYIEKE